MSRSATETFGRPVAPTEWWKVAQLPGLVEDVQICVEGDGVIDPAALAEAVAVASQACPGVRLVRRGNRWADSGRAPEVLVVAGTDFDHRRLDSKLLRKPMTAYQHSCQVILVQGAPATVVFRAHPGVMDGRGALFWLRQVFRALRGEAVEEATSHPTLDEAMTQIAAGLGSDPPAPPQPGPEWRSVLGRLPKGPRRSLWRRRTIDGIHVGVVAKIARLVTAFGDGEKDGLIEIPVDLREFLPELRSTAPVTSSVNILVREDDDWSDVNANLLTALSERRFLAHPGDPSVLGMPVPFMREMTRWSDDVARQNPSIINERKLATFIAGVSHLGKVDLTDFGAGGFEATSCYSLGTCVYMPEFDIMESRGRTEVTLAWRGGPGVAERAEALLDWIADGLSPREHRVWAGNQTGRSAPPDTLTSLLAAQVRRTPDAVAISGPDGELSYAALARQAATVTAALTERGIGRGDLVGLVAGRSAAAIAAIWGILGAGAAYLPIDASYPDTRITQLLTDAAASACLLEAVADQRDLLPAGCEGISLDTLPPAGGTAPWPVPGIGPEDLAYVIFTSGSTGTPKGVEIEHRSLVNYARWSIREAGIDATTKMPLIASISFDLSGSSIYLPLLAGGTILPVPEVNAVTLREVIQDRGATALAITPSHLELINQSGIRHSALRVIVAAGELLRRSTAVRAREIFGPHCQILNQWGPTEAAVLNTCHRFDPGADTEAGVPLGRPMDNNTVYLLDSRGRFVPPGEPGEACIGGIQLARGYLGRPDLTRDKFVRLADGTRIYRTGDIARLLPTGVLAFISRADDQVKVAGHRIEPAEIAQALEEHPDVRQAAVVARSRPGRHDKELCGYVVTSTATDGLKEYLATRLPRYMVPAAILAVPEIPRNANGKVDARQLPDPFSHTPSSAAPPLEPQERDHVTNAVAGIWARALQVDASVIDERTDFRELGGNSLMTLSMIDEVSRMLAADAQPQFMAELDRLIREPTLGRVSEIARQTRNGHSDQRAAAGP